MKTPKQSLLYSTCPRDCYDTCSIVTAVKDGNAIKLRGNVEHPITQGFLCWKIQNGLKFVYSPKRLRYPLKRVGKKGNDEFQRISWNDAYGEIANQFSSIKDRFGSGAILPVDYYGHMGLLNKQFSHRFFNAFGTSNCTPTVCSHAGRTALQHVYGGFWGVDPDVIQTSKLIIHWGLNGPWSNLHGYNLIKRAIKNGAKYYVIDPKQTGKMGTHLAIKPNTDGVLALGIANYLISSGLYEREHVEKHTYGFKHFVEVAKEFPLEKVSQITEIRKADIRKLAEDLYQLRPNFIHLGFGLQKHLYGGEAVRTIALLPPLVGGFRVHYSNTDRELDLEFLQGKQFVTKAKIEENKKSYNMAQLGKVLEADEVKSLFIFNTNPVVNLPNQQLVKKGLMRDDLFVVVHDLFLNDTCSYADIVLPATSFLESFDVHVSYYHNYMSLNQKAIEPLGESKANYQVFKELASALKLPADELFPPTREVLDEFFSRSASVEFTLNDLETKGFCKMRVRPQDEYKTASHKIEFYSQSAKTAGLPPLPGYYKEKSNRYPFQLLSVNLMHITRSQFHNIWQKEIEPVVLINKDDATQKEIERDDWVRVRNDLDTLNMKAFPTDEIKRGVVLVYGGLWPKLCGGKGINTLISDEVQDFGGNAAYNSTYVEIEKL